MANRKTRRNKTIYSITIILVLIIAIILLYKRYNYSEFNQNLIQIVGDSTISENKVIAYNENRHITTIHDFTLSKIDKVDDMIYYLGEPGIYYQSLSNPDEITGYKDVQTKAGTTIITPGAEGKIYFSAMDADQKFQQLCHANLDFTSTECVETELNKIEEIIYDDGFVYALAKEDVDQEKEIILKKYNSSLDLIRTVDVAEAKGQIGMLDDQYIFDITNEGLYVYEENENVVVYEMPDYKINEDDVQIKDEFVYNGDYYFVTRSNLIRVEDRLFNLAEIQTLFDQYLYHDYNNVYFLRGNDFVRYNLSTKQTDKIKVKDRRGSSASNYYVQKQ